MRIPIAYGRAQLDLEVAESDLLRSHRQAAARPLADPAAAIHEVLEAPRRFPALRRALTPDDHVAVVVDEQLPRLGELLPPILEHLLSAGVQAEAITLLCPPSPSRQAWLEQLPDEFQNVRVQVHDPADRKQLSYLATTAQGRRLYLNRTLVDADQLVVLSGWRYDPLLGQEGAEGLLYPGFSDEETRQEMCRRLSVGAPGTTAWPVRQEANEAAWLLGAPFFVQVIEGSGDTIVSVLAGLVDASAEGAELQDLQWRETVDTQASTVIAGVSGDPARHTFADLARALSCAARVVQSGGQIVLLSQVAPALGPGAALLRSADDPECGLSLLRQQKPPDMAAAFQWASAAKKAKIYLLSELPGEVGEELFAVPLESANQTQRLLTSGETCLVIHDAHKALAVTTDGQDARKPRLAASPRRAR
jgi:nickel-dependent lactate racemase